MSAKSATFKLQLLSERSGIAKSSLLVFKIALLTALFFLVIPLFFPVTSQEVVAVLALEKLQSDNKFRCCLL